MKRLLLFFLATASPLWAALAKPSGVAVSSGGPVPVFNWEAVEGAAMYRVAVFAAPDEEGKRELMAAVWVKGQSWAYGSGKVLAKAGKLPSTKPKPLEAGADYKVMVSAADPNGMNKSDWASAEFGGDKAEGGAPSSGAAAQPEALSVTASPSPSATPTSSPTPGLDAQGSTSAAELEVDLSAEFKESPEAGEGGLSKTAAASTFEEARALLQQGKAEAAEAAYKALIEKDSSDADLWEGLGDSYDARKMKVEAKEAYENALAIDKKRERLNQWMRENVKR